MLLNFNNPGNLYIVGSSVSAYELQTWIQPEVLFPVQVISLEQFAQLPSGSHCMMGFQTLEYRTKFVDHSKHLAHNWPTYVHPRAFVSDITQIGHGVVIHPLACLGHGVKINNFIVVCPQVSIGHGTHIGTNVVVSPGTTIGGSTSIGNNVIFGQSCSIKDKITISSDTEFYMNSVVTRDIDLPGIYYGNKYVKV